MAIEEKKVSARISVGLASCRVRREERRELLKVASCLVKEKERSKFFFFG